MEKKIKKEEDKEEYFGYPRPSNPHYRNQMDMILCIHLPAMLKFHLCKFGRCCTTTMLQQIIARYSGHLYFLLCIFLPLTSSTSFCNHCHSCPLLHFLLFCHYLLLLLSNHFLFVFFFVFCLLINILLLVIEEMIYSNSRHKFKIQ